MADKYTIYRESRDTFKIVRKSDDKVIERGLTSIEALDKCAEYNRKSR